MLLFRSGQHVERWCRQWRWRRGGTLSLSQGWKLAREWYHDRLSDEWRPKTVPEAQEALSRIGLMGNFWKLAE
jgi:adenosylcobinamide amidohydrolase